MNRTFVTTLLAIGAVTVTAVAQAPSADTDPQRLSNLIAEVRAQRAQIAANQTKIDEKLATLGDAIRVARIYSSRGGR